MFTVKYLLLKLTRLSGLLLLTLAPTLVFYIVSNFIENIMLGPLSTNSVRQKKRGGVSYLCGILDWIQYTDPWVIVVNAIKTINNVYGCVTV